MRGGGHPYIRGGGASRRRGANRGANFRPKAHSRSLRTIHALLFLPFSVLSVFWEERWKVRSGLIDMGHCLGPVLTGLTIPEAVVRDVVLWRELCI